MRKLALGMALASTALATPALARDGQWYVGVEGGAMIVEDVDLDIAGISNTASIDHDTGYDFDGIVGYDFGSFRLEAEVGYKQASSGDLIGTTPVLGGAFIPGLGNSGNAGYFIDTNGDVNALSFMLNGMVDFGDDDGLQGFVGGGVGVARTELTNIIATPWLDDSDTGFAWQAIAGVRAPISDSWDVGLKYRYFNTTGVDLVDSLGRDVSTDVSTHSILGSLIYNFGGEPAAPPPPPQIGRASCRERV